VIHGAHVLLYSSDASADRAFIRDVLAWPAVDAGGGWLIFGMPPAELAVHPADGEAGGARHSGHTLLQTALYLMCDDVRAEVAALTARGVACSEIEEEHWGIRTTIRLPSGGEVGLYQPLHETALGLG